MTVRTQDLDLDGYPRCGSIVIQYSIPDGVQKANHPNPGQRYRGAYRTALLPNNVEGWEICSMLQQAFNAGLIFTVGKSTTTGRENVVTWNDIHHKTQYTGEFGYPDPNYLSRVRDELAAKGITAETSSVFRGSQESSSSNSPSIFTKLFNLVTGTGNSVMPEGRVPHSTCRTGTVSVTNTAVPSTSAVHWPGYQVNQQYGAGTNSSSSLSPYGAEKPTNSSRLLPTSSPSMQWDSRLATTTSLPCPEQYSHGATSLPYPSVSERSVWLHDNLF